MPPGRKPNIPQDYWTLDRAKKESANKDFDQSSPTLPASKKHEKLRDTQGKFKGTK
jgi:hypothetical protein